MPAPASGITRTYTVTTLAAAGEDNVAVSLSTEATPVGGAYMGGATLSITLPNADAAGFAVHDTVELTLSKK